MKKNLLYELVLPSFWLFFIMVSPSEKNPAARMKIDRIEQGQNVKSINLEKGNKDQDLKFIKGVYYSKL